MCPLKIELEGFQPSVITAEVDRVQIMQTGLGLVWFEKKGQFSLYTQKPGPSNISASSTLPRIGDRFEIRVNVTIPHPDAGQPPLVLPRTLTLRRVEDKVK